MENYNIFLPIIGIVIGWTLSELSDRLSGYRADKRILKKTLSDLILVRQYNLILIMNMRTAAKYATEFDCGFAEMEKRRQRNNELHLDEEDKIRSLIQTITEETAYIDPFLSDELSAIATGIKAQSKMIMDNISLNDFIYIDMLMNVESILEISLRTSEKAMKKIALKIGIVSRLKVVKVLKMNEYDDSKSVIDFMNPKKIIAFSENLKSELKKE